MLLRAMVSSSAITQSITTQSSSMKDDDVTQGVSMQEMSALQDVSKQGTLESVESACVSKSNPTQENFVPKSSVLSLTSSPGALKSSCGVPKSVSSVHISDVPKTSFAVQRTTPCVMQPCPLCQVTYPSDVIEIHASTCQGGFLEDDDFDPADFISEPPIDQNKNPKNNDTNFQNSQLSVRTSHSDVLKSKSDVLISESGVPKTNGAPSLRGPQPSSPVQSSSSKSSSSPRRRLYITQEQSSSTDCSSRALTKSADMTKSARTEIQKIVPKSASSGFFESAKDSISNLLGVKRITLKQTTEDVSKTQSQTQQNQIQNGQNDSPNDTHDMTPNHTPHLTPKKGHPSDTNSRPRFSLTGCSPVRTHTNSSALVECPVCGSSFKESLIFEHAEHCEEEFSLQDGEESGNY
ncbi:unnamed protein product [Owenia fusiformis]|uniref:Uncharacterized protein n=1 Tax=Owenia fusiformis TaxID=6347 RepID=A0A8J1XPG9_OWEFU|nr:unnamed protein product [Owenia fusiformis]